MTVQLCIYVGVVHHYSVYDMAEISWYFLVYTYHIPALLRLQDQVPLVSLVSLMMMAMKYFPWMCTLPHTTFLQTQVCVCVCMKSTCVHMCAYMCVFM